MAANPPVDERSAAQTTLRSSHARDNVSPPVPTARWLYVLEAWPPLAVHGLALFLALAVGHADSLSLAYDAALFYLLPVALTAWRLGRNAGLLWSIAAAAICLVAAADAGATAPESYWSAAMHLALLSVVAVTVAEVRALTGLARTLAGTDHLTGLLDSYAFQELVELERSRALRYNRPFTLAYLDVDRLRAVNDLGGHTTGDRALQLISRTIRENLRSMDSVARLAGDEFGLLLPETGRGAAEVALSKIRDKLDEVARAHRLPVTFSVGAVICVGAPESVDRLINRADALMYRVKEAGGDGLLVEVLDDPFGIEAILQRS